MVANGSGTEVKSNLKCDLSLLLCFLFPVTWRICSYPVWTQFILQYVTTGLKGQLLSRAGLASMSLCFCWSLNVSACDNEKKHTRVSKNQYDPGRNSQYFVKNPHNDSRRVYVRCCSDLQDFSSYPVGLQKLCIHFA